MREPGEVDDDAGSIDASSTSGRMREPGEVDDDAVAHALRTRGRGVEGR